MRALVVLAITLALVASSACTRDVVRVVEVPKVVVVEKTEVMVVEKVVRVGGAIVEEQKEPRKGIALP